MSQACCGRPTWQWNCNLLTNGNQCEHYQSAQLLYCTYPTKTCSQCASWGSWVPRRKMWNSKIFWECSEGLVHLFFITDLPFLSNYIPTFNKLFCIKCHKQFWKIFWNGISKSQRKCSQIRESTCLSKSCPWGPLSWSSPLVVNQALCVSSNSATVFMDQHTLKFKWHSTLSQWHQCRGHWVN